jgi:butyryl-CoA dehydrogenase
MEFQYTPEQTLARETARRFAEEVLKPQAIENDRLHRFPHSALRKAKELGFYGIYIPPTWGGAGLDCISYVLIIEEISKVCPSTGVILSVNNSLVCDPIYRFGTEEQKREFLIPLARGEYLGCFCLSEPGAGSDAGNLKTTARKVNGDWVLNGTKNFITNGKEAQVALVFAVTDPQKKHRGITAFLVPTDTPGFRVGKEEEKMGIRATSTVQVHLEDVRIPDRYRLGDVSEGFVIAMKTLEGGRIGIASQAVGIAMGAFESALRYAEERKAFGQKISDFQGIQWTFADMITRIECAHLLTLKAAWLKQEGQKYGLYASQAKLFASETAVEVTRKAVQIFGGYGYIAEYPVEHLYRDAKITEIYEGTSEIQRLIIFREICKEYLSGE